MMKCEVKCKKYSILAFDDLTPCLNQDQQTHIGKTVVQIIHRILLLMIFNRILLFLFVISFWLLLTFFILYCHLAYKVSFATAPPSDKTSKSFTMKPVSFNVGYFIVFLFLFLAEKLYSSL